MVQFIFLAICFFKKSDSVLFRTTVGSQVKQHEAYKESLVRLACITCIIFSQAQCFFLPPCINYSVMCFLQALVRKQEFRKPQRSIFVIFTRLCWANTHFNFLSFPLSSVMILSVFLPLPSSFVKLLWNQSKLKEVFKCVFQTGMEPQFKIMEQLW